MKYRLPTKADEQLLKEYMQEHHDNGEMGVSASLGFAAMLFEDWLEQICRNALDGNAEWGKSLLYLCFDDQLKCDASDFVESDSNSNLYSEATVTSASTSDTNISNEKLVGLLSIRYELPKDVSDSIGDIGYGVRPSERRKGYATQMLRYALEVCKDKGKSSVIVGCYKDNIPSVLVIKKCDGILVNETDGYRPGVTSQYYEIKLV